MRIECPGCDAAYEVPEDQIRPGRSVRCVRCVVQWRPAGASPEDGLTAAPAGTRRDEAPRGDEPPAREEAVRDGIVRLRQSGVPAPLAAAGEPLAAAGKYPARGVAPDVRRLATWRMGWMASLMLLGGLLVSATYWRRTIMQDWPPSVRLYTTLGAQPPQT